MNLKNITFVSMRLLSLCAAPLFCAAPPSLKGCVAFQQTVRQVRAPLPSTGSYGVTPRPGAIAPITEKTLSPEAVRPSAHSPQAEKPENPQDKAKLVTILPTLPATGGAVYGAGKLAKVVYDLALSKGPSKRVAVALGATTIPYGAVGGFELTLQVMDFFAEITKEEIGAGKP